MGPVLDKSRIDELLEKLPQWQQTAYKSFSSIIADDKNMYPCIPARQSYLSNNLRYSFVGNPKELKSAEQLADALREYGECSRGTGNYASLAVFFETPGEIFQNYTIEDYRELFWDVLNNVSRYDPNEWPEDIPINPANHQWEFCFDGNPYFVFCATPAHKIRKSRHFPCLFMAFQPRWVFEEMNDSTAFGRNLKKLIRQRLVDYDGIQGHPDLKWYGLEDNHEWKQYFISDDESSPSKCPFMRMKRKITDFLK